MSAAEDYAETRARRQNRSAPATVKPEKQYIFFVCDNCNYACTVEAPAGWNGTHHCSHCGGKMTRK